MGRDLAEAYWSFHDGFDLMLVTNDNEIYMTEGLEGKFKLNESSQGIPVHVIRK